MNILSKIKNLDKKTKINLSIVILIIIAAIIATVVIFMNRTQEVAQTYDIKEAKVADVTESEFKVEYNEAPTSESVALNIKEYDNSYNLYYYIQEVGQVLTEEKTEEKDNEQDEKPVEQPDVTVQEIEKQIIDDKEYVLYSGQPISIEANSILSFKYEKDGVFSQNAYQLKITNIIDDGEITEGATEEELKEANVDEEEKAKGEATYYIKINYTANCVTIYKKDDSGNYTVPVKAMVCSTGTATPTGGTYKTMNKYVWKELNGHCWGQYSTRIVGHILFHSVPYSSPSHDDLKYNLYDKLGTRASAGCIRLTTADAKWIYDNCALGTMVEFYSSSNPGPLGKPSAQKIVNVPECRDWDPTDPAPGNPWRSWNGQTQPQSQPASQPVPAQSAPAAPAEPSKPATPAPEPPTPTNNETNTAEETNTTNETSGTNTTGNTTNSTSSNTNTSSSNTTGE